MSRQLCKSVSLQVGMQVNIAGPYGYPIGSLEDHDSVIAIGTGTGIVPMLSLLHQARATYV